VRYNDLPAVAYAVAPSLFQMEDLYVTVETQSPLCRGQTVADRRGLSDHSPNVRVCLGVDASRLTEMFVERLASG
jgi:inosine-uridine nucleoside N-ribohydrolase